MEIKTLHYYIAVVESTTISGAANILHISQPSLSRQIQTFEEELGLKLFERGARGIMLTEAGKHLYHRAKSIVEYTETTKKELQDLRHGIGGSLRIGTISSCGPMLLPNIISGFQQKYPNVRFKIFERNTYELIDSMENNLIELAFVRTPFDQVGIYRDIILTEEPLIAVGRDFFFPAPTESPLPVLFFEGKPLIIYRRWQKILKAFFAGVGIKPFVYCENDDARTCVMWANAGLGIAIVPESIAKSIPGEQMCYIQIDASNLTTEVRAIWNDQRYISQFLRNFIDHLQEFKISAK